MEMQSMLTEKEVTFIQPSSKVKDTEKALELNSRNGLLSSEKAVPPLIPIDKYKIVFFVLVLHGIGTLMPWNMFITAKSYFSHYKLNVSESSQEYSKNFLSYHGFAAQLPNLLCNGLNAFIQTSKGSLTQRVTISLVIELLVFLLTIILAIVDTISWPGLFFYITMGSVVVLNMANGVYQNCVYGIAANLPMEYSNAVVLGSNISGVLTSVISILTIAVSPNIKTAAIYYFLTALLVLFLCVDTYFALPLSRFYSYHSNKDKTTTDDGLTRRPPYLKIFGQIWPQCLNVFLVFFVTLAVFPAVTANVESYGSAASWGDYFVPVACFLVFNVTAMLGNLLPSWITYPGPDRLWIPVVVRFLFLPFFFFCNYNPKFRVYPVYIRSDTLYIVGGSLLGLSSGYYSSLCMMYSPRLVKPEYAPTAGMLTAFFLICGIFAGVNFSFLISWIAEKRF